MPAAAAAVLYCAVLAAAIYAGARVGARVDDRYRRAWLAWVAGFGVFLVVGVGAQLALTALIPDYGWRVDALSGGSDYTW